MDNLENDIQVEKMLLAKLIRRKEYTLMNPFAIYGPGKCFGELALQIDKLNPTKPPPNRAATIICLDNCKFATMTKNDYQ